MKETIPICIFGFNRADLINKLFNSLIECDGAYHYHVYVFVDGARSEKEQVACNEVARVVNRYSNYFSKFEVKRSSENRGLANSLKEGISFVLGAYDAVIVLEDDLVLSKDFLTYMNQALNFYEYDKRVGSISGFTTELIASSQYDSYFHPRPCSWGWATWKDRWESCDWDYIPSDFNQKLRLKLSAYKAGQDVYRMFQNQLKGKINSWAIIWTVNHLLKSLHVVYPYQSKVKNIGFGEDATHCKGVNPFPTNFSDSDLSNFSFDNNVTYRKEVLNQVNFYHSNKYKLLFKLGLI
ncbi:glycosyltransferase [Vibrio owensii]|uniref:glycosyltransferase n=1 Tax=Vibrio owensii TaxID=696485 RepID=UPI00148E0748|nr:glycosyltransferase [Vibrio owensii]NOI71458.1 glycosyltransferase [Vibrio owensii]